jgi:hypothetical protein
MAVMPYNDVVPLSVVVALNPVIGLLMPLALPYARSDALVIPCLCFLLFISVIELGGFLTI